MDQKLNYKALVLSVFAAAIIFGYMLLETNKLEEAAAAHGEARAELAASER
jgi:hypothetical protein